MNKSVGVIGGLGPETTAEFYLRVIFGYQKFNAERRPSVIIASVPLPFEVERDFIRSNTSKERYIPYLIGEAQRLEKAGASFLVMPCNTLHMFIERIRDSVNIPVLSIVEETVKYIKKNNLAKVGLISTLATVKNGVYENIFKRENIDFFVPDDLKKAEINEIILRLINGKRLDTDRETILEVARNFKNIGADAVVLACTDLQLLQPSSDLIKIIDTMKILADATVSYMLK